MPLSMGKVLGGDPSINGLGWARGHKNDWDSSHPSPATQHGTMSRY